MEEQRVSQTPETYSPVPGDAQHPVSYAPGWSHNPYSLYPPSGYHGYATGYPYPYHWPQSYDPAYYSYYGAYGYPYPTSQRPEEASPVPSNVTESHDTTSSTPSDVMAPNASNSIADALSSSIGQDRKCSADDGKPPYSYIALVAMAISNSPQEMATLREIIDYIENRFPYYKTKTTWQRSLRHCLTLNDCFVKRARRSGDRGHPWAIDSEFRDMFDNGSLLRRRYRFKKGSANWHRSRARATKSHNKSSSTSLEKLSSAISTECTWTPSADEQRGALDTTLASETSVISVCDVTTPSENSVMSSADVTYGASSLASPFVDVLDESAQNFWNLSDYGFGN